MQVELKKKIGSYVDEKDGTTKKSIRFYVQCGDTLVPIEPCYFENKELGRDPGYAARKEVLKAFASELIDLNSSKN
jgi:hypothetical protein